MDVGNNYPEWTKEQLLLLMIWNKLQEAYDSGESELRVMVVRADGDNVGVQLGYSTMAVNVSEEIPELKRGGEAVAVFESLRQGGYLYGDFPRVPQTVETPIINRLSPRGLLAIGKYPNPDERFAAAIAATQRAIEQSNLPESEKRDMLGTLDKLLSIAERVTGLANVFLQYAS